MMLLKILSEFDKFAKSITPEDNVAILTDSDTDGITAGAITFRAVQKLAGKQPKLVVIGRPESQSSRADVLKHSFDKVLKRLGITVFICCDISLDQSPRKELAETIAKNARVLNIDHHKVYGQLKCKNCLVVKPQFFSKKNPTYYCAAKMSFDLFSRVVDLREFQWMAALGIFGDFGVKEWKKFYNAALKKTGISNSRIVEMHEILGAVKAIEERRLDKCFESLLAEKPKKALRKFLNVRKRFLGELARLGRDFFKNAEHFGEISLYFYVLKSKFQICGSLINELSQKIPESTVIVCQREDGFVKMSARRQDGKVAMNALVEEAVKGLKDAMGGGHAPAAGAKVRAKDLAKFRKKVVEILQKQYLKA